MFQYTWFNKSNFKGSLALPAIDRSDWISPEDIQLISITKWCEHCVECAAPQCYGHCENWVEREDKKCQKTFYGTYQNAAPSGTAQAAQLKFRRWGKIETLLFPGFVSINEYKALDKSNKRNERIALSASRWFKRKYPALGLCGIQTHFTNKAYLKKGKRTQADAFVVQCYSPSRLEYKLHIEAFTSQEVFYRNSLRISKGYNQGVFDGIKYRENARIRIYPENDIQDEIVFFLCDCIVYKKKTANRDYAPKVKCVAWDLDNTIWDGILIESDPAKLKLRDGVLSTIKALDERGVIQVIVSKNNEAETMPVLQRLGILEYFVYTSINWSPKSENIKRLAELININVNSFAFIDDSSFERGEVGDNLPNVRVYTEQDINSLLELPEFNMTVTADSRNRRAMYQVEAKRKKLQDEYNGNYIDFLKSCNLVMTIRHVDDLNLKRCYELVQRTNQLNLSGTKYEEEEFSDLCRHRNEDSFVAFCKDKYGEYGQVGFFMIHLQGDMVIFDEYVMSCRVAAKWVEPALMQWIIDHYNARSVWLVGRNSKKKNRLINTMKEFGFKETTLDETMIRMQIKKEQMNWPEIVKVIDET